MAKKSVRSTLNSLKDFDRDWNHSSIDDILSQEQIHAFIEKAYNNSSEPSRVYANVEFRKVSESYMKRINDVIAMCRNKEREVERIGRATKLVLNEKIKKIDILVNYIKLLEKKLDENGIEFDKPDISDAGDLLFLGARKSAIDTSILSGTDSEFVEAEEIELNGDAEEAQTE